MNNFQQGGVSGYENRGYVVKVDYDFPHIQRVSYSFAHGVRQSVASPNCLALHAMMLRKSRSAGAASLSS